MQYFTITNNVPTTKKITTVNYNLIYNIYNYIVDRFIRNNEVQIKNILHKKFL